MAEQQQRSIARIVSIKNINNGTYIQNEGWTPNAVRTTWGEEVERVHIVGTIIEKRESPNQLRLDDGSGQIDVRSFDPIEHWDKLEVGTLVRLIGKPRHYNNIMYVVPEILKILDSTKWLKYHHALLKHFEKNKKIIKHEKTEEVEIDPHIVEEDDTTLMLDCIESLDDGNGVSIEEAEKKLKEKFQLENPKNFIDQLMLQGDIFEIRAGYIKVLK